MPKFKVGDRIISKKNTSYIWRIDKVGLMDYFWTIVDTREDSTAASKASIGYSSTTSIKDLDDGRCTIQEPALYALTRKRLDALGIKHNLTYRAK